MTRSGAAAGKLPKCKMFDQMTFIKDSVTNRPTTSNLNIEDSSDMNFPESPASITATPVGGSRRKSNTRKRKLEKPSIDSYDAMLIEALKDDGVPKAKVFDADVSFAESIIPILKKLPDKQNRKAKIKIQQILFECEFDEQQNN